METKKMSKEEIDEFIAKHPKAAINKSTLSNTMKYNLGIRSVSENSIIQSQEIQFYNLETIFTFGMYEGKSVKEVIEINPTYLNWCAININPFYMTDEAIEEIRNIATDYISSNSREILHEKYIIWKENKENNM